jgi:hypothetical protein
MKGDCMHSVLAHYRQNTTTANTAGSCLSSSLLRLELLLAESSTGSGLGRAAAQVLGRTAETRTVSACSACALLR